MAMFTKRGAEAVTSATTEKDDDNSVILPFTSGTTYKVRFKSAEDSVEYYAYGIFGKVNTFVPKVPSERNAKGFVTDNPTIWDRASELLYAEAKAAKDAGDDDTYEKIRKQAYLLKGKPKYLVAFVNLADGQYGVVDLTPKQASGVFATIQKYAKRLDKLAFELSKTGSSTNTTVSLTPILDMDEELTEQERKNFEAADALEPFDFALFETCLYVADEAEQTKNLEIAGFDIRRLGLSSEAAATAADGAVTPLPKNDGNKPEIIF